jgi:hypothetical protein
MAPIILSPRGLERAASISEHDFVFIGKSCTLPCTRLQAAFISPYVHALLEIDRTLNSFVIESQRRQKHEQQSFEWLRRLVSGLPIDPSGSELDEFLEMASFLGNTEILDQVFTDESAILESTVCSLLRHKWAAGRRVDREVEFAANHFHEIDHANLKELDVSILEEIISSPVLHLDNEDSLLDFICSLPSEAQIVLLRYLRIEYLTCESMNVLLDCLPDSGLDPFVWYSLCRRLCLPVSPSASGAIPRFVRPTLKFPKSQDKPLEGIISYLTKEHGGNVHEKGIVNLTSKSVLNQSGNRLRNVADRANNYGFSSEDEPGQWICWDFGGMRVRPTHYTLWARYLISWVVEGSLDGMRWTEMDRHTGSKDFTASWNRGSFALANSMECRFIRLTQTSKNQSGHDQLFSGFVEFFGSLSE